MGDFSLFEAMRALATQFAAFEALLLIVSAVHKIVERVHLRNVIQRFAGVPLPLTSAALAGAVICESVAGVLLLVPSYRAAGAVLAACVWALYLALILRSLIQGRRNVDCGCSFGPEHPLGFFQVARNGILLGMTVFVAWATSSASTSAVDFVQGSQIVAACASLALYGALDQVMALRPLRSGEML
jgi:uncharacterized membrane protein YphA (DoxX/SURF4 family)